MKKLSRFNRLLFFANVVFSVLLLLACLVPYTTSASLSFLSLMVPLLVVFNIFFLVYWFFKKRKFWVLSVITLMVGYFALGSFVKLRVKPDITSDPELKVMSFNSMVFYGFRKTNWKNTPSKITSFVKGQNPDVLCFQEFDKKEKRKNNFSTYSYRYFYDGNEKNNSRVLQAIFSKFPIAGKGSLQFPDSRNNGIFADIVKDSDTIRIYNLHLQSLRIRPGSIKRERSDRLFQRLRVSFAKQLEQAEIVRKHVEASPYEVIICGDFNNTQFSNVYRIIKGDMLDTFTEKGSGYGKTIDFWRFPLRIDFILADSKFEILEHQNFNVGLSDHEPIMASFKMRANK